MYSVFAYEKRTVKPVEIVLRGEMKRMMEEVNLTEIHCKHICKYHKEPPKQLIYANKNYLKSHKN
jgi:hypothetical protein